MLKSNSEENKCWSVIFSSKIHCKGRGKPVRKSTGSQNLNCQSLESIKKLKFRVPLGPQNFFKRETFLKLAHWVD